MAINYTWDVKNVDTYPSHTDSQDPANTKSDVIYNVHWKLNAVDDANNDAKGNPQSASVYGSLNLDVSNLSSFIDFSSVSLANVQSWVEAGLGSSEVTNLKSGLDAQIAEQITPTSVSKVISS
jgi:hypothetical protein